MSRMNSQEQDGAVRKSDTAGRTVRVAIVYHSVRGHVAKLAAALDAMPNSGDLATARHLGRRVVEVTRQVLVGRHVLAGSADPDVRPHEISLRQGVQP